VSWAINAGAKEINLITDWPNPTTRYANPHSERVPTMISYDPYDRSRANKWGYEAALNEKTAFRWFKLLLEPDYGIERVAQQFHEKNEMNKMLVSIQKTAQDVTADYLRFLWSHAEEHFRKHLSSVRKGIDSIKVVITVPAMSSRIAKESTRNAAKAAGLPGDVTLVHEPEAAALAVLRDTWDTLQVRANARSEIDSA